MTSDADRLQVVVRAPFQPAAPHLGLRRRWRERRSRRRRRNDDGGDRSSWLDAVDIPIDGVDALVMVVVIVLGVVALVLLAPFAWIALLFIVEAIVWVVLMLVGMVAWLLLGRAWTVAVVDEHGTAVATARVRGRRQARAHAETVRHRMRSGTDPASAVLHR